MKNLFLTLPSSLLKENLKRKIEEQKNLLDQAIAMTGFGRAYEGTHICVPYNYLQWKTL